MMRTLITLMAATVSLIASAIAQEKPAAAPATGSLKKISTAEASKHIGESLVVTGSVAQVSIRPKVVYINVDKKFPESPFTCVIFSGATNGFGDLKALEGKQIEASGKLESFHDKPQLILSNATQLKIVGSAPAPAAASKP